MGSNRFQDTIKACSTCLLCRHACTVGNVTLCDTNLPRGKALLLLAIQKGLQDWDKRAVEVVYQCTNCHLCREWCPPGWDIAPLMLAARAEVVDAGITPSTAQLIKLNFENYGNPYGEAHTLLEDWIKDLPQSNTPEVLYYAGTSVSYRLPEIARAAVSIFQHCGTPFTILRNEPDSGELLYSLGFRTEAKVWASRALEAIRTSGVNIVISSDPTCIEAFRHGYHDWGLEVPENIRFLHMSEFLSDAIHSGTLKLTGSRKGIVTYHDPCSLGREMRVFDAPREVLSNIPGINLREMRLNREHSPCCGYGGGVPATFPEIATGAGANAGAIILETGADILVTSCPSCHESLKKHVPGMEILDLTVIVAQALKSTE